MSRARPLLGEEGVRLLAEDAKLALLATVDAHDLPHVTLITSLQAASPSRLLFGQFCEGLSKGNVRERPRTGFLALDRGRRWIRGKATWTGSAGQGDDYEAYNRKPMFRYNAYFGIHTVHYLDVVEAEDARSLAAAPLAGGALLARATALVAGGGDGNALTPWSRALIDRPTTLKFLSFVGADGHPVLVPAVAAATRGGSRVVLAPTLGADEIPAIAAGSHVALFAIDLEMRSVLLRGVFPGWRGPKALATAAVDVDWVYNTMPPKQGQIHPAVPLAAVDFAAAAASTASAPSRATAASATAH